MRQTNRVQIQQSFKVTTKPQKVAHQVFDFFLNIEGANQEKKNDVK